MRNSTSLASPCIVDSLCQKAVLELLFSKAKNDSTMFEFIVFTHMFTATLYNELEATKEPTGLSYVATVSVGQASRI